MHFRSQAQSMDWLTSRHPQWNNFPGYIISFLPVYVVFRAYHQLDQNMLVRLLGPGLMRLSNSCSYKHWPSDARTSEHFANICFCHQDSGILVFATFQGNRNVNRHHCMRAGRVLKLGLQKVISQSELATSLLFKAVPPLIMLSCASHCRNCSKGGKGLCA